MHVAFTLMIRDTFLKHLFRFEFLMFLYFCFAKHADRTHSLVPLVFPMMVVSTEGSISKLSEPRTMSKFQAYVLPSTFTSIFLPLDSRISLIPFALCLMTRFRAQLHHRTVDESVQPIMGEETLRLRYLHLIRAPYPNALVVCCDGVLKS